MAGLLSLLVLSGLVYAIRSLVGKGTRLDWWEDIPVGWRLPFILLGLPWLGLFVLTVIAAYAGVCEMILPKDEGGGAAQGMGLGALLVAILGGPFVIWGTVIKHKTLALSETSLFNDKVNAAVAALHSRRQVTRAITVNGEEKILTEWQDDIVQRSGAIDRLEGLVRERPSEAPRIVNMLSVYIRELSREAQDTLATTTNVDDPHAKEGHRPFRTDVEKAVQTLGRVMKIPNIDEKGIVIDLRGMDARGFDLTGLTFKNVKLGGARLGNTRFDKAFLGGVEMAPSTDLTSASLRGAAIRYVDLTKAKISQDQLEQMFGDGSMKPLPKGLEWPTHWPEETLEWSVFKQKWDAWKDVLDKDQPPPPPEGG